MGNIAIKPRLRGVALVLFAVSPWVIAYRSDDPARWTAARWAAWRDEKIDAILTPTFDYGGEKMLSRVDMIAKASAAYNEMRPLLESPAFLADTGRRAEMANFVRFVAAQRRMALTDRLGVATHALGMNISDRDYWAYVRPYVRPYVSFPPLLQSQAFLKAMSRSTNYANALGMIEAQNARLPERRKWIVFPFRAQFIRSVDRTTYGRLLVVVPNEPMSDGKLLDRWVMFAIGTPDMAAATRIKSVSVVATLRDPSQPGSSKAYMADFLRETDGTTGAISVRPNFLLSPNPSKNCYDCHKSAVLPMRPKLAYRFDESGRMVEDASGRTSIQEALDRLIESYGKSDFSHLDGDDYGPSMGASQAFRSDEFIAWATADRPICAASYPRIRANMRCGSCHEESAKLNFLLGMRNDREVASFEAKESMVKTYIEKGYMPPHNTLTPDERTALWKCLSKEYFDQSTRRGRFVDWLRGVEARS
ncbi:hypothetical protein EON82_06185 [bacterium]|nr:MAG: hypothetical protein EON82_06185 [bacterium]